MKFLKQLDKKDIYLYELSKLEEKYTGAEKLYFLREVGVTLSSLLRNKEIVAKKIAKTVADEEYQLSTASVKTITVNNKEREIYSFELTDYLIHAAVSNVLVQMISPKLQKNLFSYRKTYSIWKALGSCSLHIREYYKKNKRNKDRGLYVLCLDVKSYTNSIFVGEPSPLWGMLRDLFESCDEQPSPYMWELIKKVIRVEVKTRTTHYTKNVGIATGSPISTFLFNFYLMNLDDKLSKDGSGFYARYGDDIIYIDTDPNKVEEVLKTINETLCVLKLNVHPDKTEKYFLNVAGRKSGKLEGEKGTTEISYLGCKVNFHGTVSLNSKKVSKLLRELKNRVKRSLQQIDSKDMDERGQILCSIINKGMDPKSSLKLPYVDYLKLIINDRVQLKHLDYFIALIIAQGLAGVKTVKAFRKVPYKKMRQEWKLQSLVFGRNKVKPGATTE